MITLYSYYRSSTSYRVRIALNLKGVDYRIVPVNLATAEHRREEFLRVNPFGGLPVIEIDGQRFPQSLAILEMLEEQYPTPALWPADRAQRAQARALAYSIATDIHGMNNLRTLNYLRSDWAATPEKIEAWIAHWVAVTFEPLEAHLQVLCAGQPLPFGDVSLFEVMLVPQVYSARRFNVDLSPYPNILRIEAVCTGIDAIRRAAPEHQIDAPKG